MRRIAYIAFVFVLLFNSMGYFVVFKSVQYSIRKEIKKNIKNSLCEDQLVLIRVADNDQEMQEQIKWMEDQEFRYRDCMYDVVKMQRKNDTTNYYCINDKKEELLFTHLDRLVKHQTESTPVNGKNTAKLIKNIINEALPESRLTDIPFADATNIQTGICFQMNAVISDIPTPPPES